MTTTTPAPAGAAAALVRVAKRGLKFRLAKMGLIKSE